MLDDLQLTEDLHQDTDHIVIIVTLVLTPALLAPRGNLRVLRQYRSWPATGTTITVNNSCLSAKLLLGNLFFVFVSFDTKV